MAKTNPLKSALTTSIIAVVTVSLAVFVLKPQQEKREKEKDKSSLLYPLLDRQKIVDLKVINPNGEFEVQRKAENNDDWRVKFGGKSYDADKGSIDGLISTIMASKKEDSLSNQDAEKMGLLPAKFRLVVNDGTDTGKKELLLGDDTPVNYLVYGKWGDSKDIFTTSRSLRFGLEKKLSDFRNKKIFPALKLADLEKIEIKTLGEDKHPSEKLVFEKNSEKSDEKGGAPVWRATSKIKTKVLVTELESLLSTLQNTNATGFASDDPKERDKLGFKNPVATITFTPIATAKGASAPLAGTPYTWALSKVPVAEEKGAPKKDPKAPKTYKWYWARTDAESTFEMGETFGDHFKLDLMKFRPKELTSVKKNDVTAFSITGDKLSFEFKKSGESWTIKSTDEKGNTSSSAAKADVVNKVVESLVGLKAKGFFDEPNAAARLGVNRPSHVVELRGMKDGTETTLVSLFFGKSTHPGEVAVRTSNLDSVVSVDLKLDEIMPMKLEHFAEAAATQNPPNGQQSPATSSQAPNGSEKAAKQGAKKTKMEPTVKSLSEIKKLPAPIVKPGFKYTAEITLNDDKKMVFELAADKAPYTASNFIHLARNGFYDGLMFHRVIPEFVIQGGDPTSRGKASAAGLGMGGPGYQFDYEHNDLQHDRGVLSMAHAADPNTNGSQFFIVLQRRTTSHLDGKHTVFGKLLSGDELLDGVKQGDFMKKVEVFEQAL